MRVVSVKASRDYDILISSGLIKQIGEKIKPLFPRAKIIAVVTDDNVGPLYLRPVLDSIAAAGFECMSLSIPPGEASKSADQYISLLNWFAGNKLTRTDAICALGGGVVGDLTGFAAATYLRGIPFVQIPTTLLSMVDSSVGGKTAIDLPAGKNLAGAFYQPHMVLCDPDVLATLPEDVLGDGYAEIIKHGMLGSRDLLLDLLGETPPPIDEIIEANVKIKRNVVEEDEFESGKREILNFGHTIAHAIENLSKFRVSHGSAVAAGMAIITRSAVKKGFCSTECLNVLTGLLAKYNLPDSTEYSPKAIFEEALNDKKRAGGFITEVIPRELGVCELKKMPIDELLGWIER